MDFLLIALTALAGLALVGVRYVPEDTAYTVRRFGRQARVLAPGLRFTLPMLERVTERVRLIGHHVDVPLAGAPDSHAEVYYQILEPQRTGAVLERVDALVEQHASAALNALAAQVTLDIGAMNTHLKQLLNRDLAEFGLLVTRCDLRPDANV